MNHQINDSSYCESYPPVKIKFDSEGGNCIHEAWVKNGRVFLSNDDDAYYQQDFKNREEIQAFVDHLWMIADEAWPN